MSASGRPPLLPLDVALAQLLASVQPLSAQEWQPTLEADGRVLAQDVYSELQVPSADNSAMDGYAVRCRDLDAGAPVLALTQRIAAGHVGVELQPGTAARIFTGAPLPPGADAVVMQEDCSLLEADASAGLGARVRINQLPQPGAWIRHAGEDVARGALVLARGSRLGPAALGLAASIGLDRLAVLAKPRVALFSTGDELVQPGTVAPQDMPAGAIYNSNRFFLLGLLRRLGCAVTDYGIVPDRLEATQAALRTAAASHDLILTSGGVSVGEEDHLRPAVQALGALDLWQIAMKPGKPFAHGRIGAAHFIGLPGNPVASFVTFLVLVRPFLLRLAGGSTAAPDAQQLPAHFDWPRSDRRREFLRVRRNAQGGLDLFANQGSSLLTSVLWCDGLVDNPPGQVIRRGDPVCYLPLSGLLSCA